ncbi:MAG: hypothetical protein CL521_02140 [Actinobacteria bacterium]|nr:hypothetical protein [Actinomycetota bacterium]
MKIVSKGSLDDMDKMKIIDIINGVNIRFEITGARASRGEVNHNEVCNFISNNKGIQVNECLGFLSQSSSPQLRTMMVNIIQDKIGGLTESQKESVAEILCATLKTEGALYTRVALSECLGKLKKSFCRTFDIIIR